MHPIDPSTPQAVTRPYILLMYVQRMVFGRTFAYLDNLGLMTLATVLEHAGYRARVFTGLVTEAYQLITGAGATHPIFAVGLYCDYDNQTVVSSLSRRIKTQHHLRVLVGGPQVKHLGEAFLRDSRCDYLVRGDGEATLLELLPYLVTGQGDREHINGITYLDTGGTAVSTPARALPDRRQMDQIPPVSATHLLTSGPKYNLSTIAGRGCPFRCAFCYEGGNTKNLRLRSVTKVIEEIRLGLAQTPSVKYVWFADDTFTVNPSRTEQFCRALAGLRRDYDFVWFCEAHPRRLFKWPHLVPMMIEAGLVRMQIGMESGWPGALKLYRKRTTPEEIEAVVQQCWQAGLPQLDGNFIIGGAYETPQTIAMTQAFATKLLRATPGLLDLSSTFVTPLPQTAICRHPHTFGLTLIDPDALTSLEDFPVTATESLSTYQISDYRYHFVTAIHQVMRETFEAREIPFHRIKQHVALAIKYGIASSWYSSLYGKDPIVSAYFSRLVTTAGTKSPTSRALLPDDWYPGRVFPMDKTIQWSDAQPYIRNQRLSPMEFQLLLLCSGKLNIRTIRTRMLAEFPAELTHNNAAPKLTRMLKTFEERYWVLFYL